MDDRRHEPSQPRLRLSGICPSIRHVAHFYLCRCRTVRLRFRLHRPHLLHDALQQGTATNRPLRHLHRLHGSRHDASGHDFRLHSRTRGIPELFPLDHVLYYTQLFSRTIRYPGSDYSLINFSVFTPTRADSQAVNCSSSGTAKGFSKATIAMVNVSV